jgi:hypothetical protein
MLNSKKFIMMALLTLLAVAPIMATENGSGRFSLAKPLFASGTEIKAGTYDIKFETNDKSASVTFMVVGKAQKIEVQGKVQSVEAKSEYDSMGVGKDSQGRDAIKRISFSGKKIQIIFE